MGGLLDGDARGGPDELRSIVARAGRARARIGAVAAAVALAAGGGIGYGIASAASGGTGSQLVATSPPSGTSGPSAANGAASPSFAGSGAAVLQPIRFDSLFTRQVGSIDIRGFLISEPNPLPAEGIAGCGVGAVRFQAEVSTPHMVGVAPGFVYQDSTTGAILFSQPTVIGVQEGDPTAVVVAYTSSDVALVKMAFTGGSSDQMAPAKGWSALVAPFPAGASTRDTNYGTLTALDHSGHVLSEVKVQVAPKPPLQGVSGSGSGSSGSGSISPGTVHASGGGSGVASSGSSAAGSGAVSSPPASVGSPPASVVNPPESVPNPVSPSYPCKVTPVPTPTPVPLPPCPQQTTVNGVTYAYSCPAQPPVNGPTTPSKAGSGG
jgi:hypothetical protein